MIRDRIERQKMLITDNEYFGLKREFPNTDIKRTKILFEITGFYFYLSIGLIFLMAWIKNHPEYFIGKYIFEEIYEILQNQSVKYQYINRILANGWWFVFLTMPIIYYNDRRKQKNKKIINYKWYFFQLLNVIFSCISCTIMYSIFETISDFQPFNIYVIFILFIIPFIFSICPQMVLHKIMTKYNKNNIYIKIFDILLTIILAIVFSLILTILIYGKKYTIKEIIFKEYYIYISIAIAGIIYRLGLKIIRKYTNVA
jgi:hypothetical protein